MIHPLRLRLRVCPSKGKPDGVWYLTGGRRILGNRGKDYLAQPAILEFENPLNGTWHPVEVVADEAAPNE